MDIDKEMCSIRQGEKEELTKTAIKEIMSYNADELYEFAMNWAGQRQVLEVFKKMDISKLKNIMPMMLDYYLGDLNYEGSKEVSSFIISLGKEAIPFIKEVLRGRGQELIYNVLTEVVEYLSKDIVVELEKELEKLVWDCDFENGYQIDALRILFKKGIWSYDKYIARSETLSQTYEFFLEKLKDDRGKYTVT